MECLDDVGEVLTLWPQSLAILARVIDDLVAYIKILLTMKTIRVERVICLVRPLVG